MSWSLCCRSVTLMRYSLWNGPFCVYIYIYNDHNTVYIYVHKHTVLWSFKSLEHCRYRTYNGNIHKLLQIFEWSQYCINTYIYNIHSTMNTSSKLRFYSINFKTFKDFKAILFILSIYKLRFIKHWGTLPEDDLQKSKHVGVVVL